MATIRNLFDSSRALNRPIEKVITYQNRSETQLRAEISEYVATERIEESFSDLLKKMQLAMQGGGGHEIGVWVSGFYGSGKSSFTKYLGFALDRSLRIGNDSFLDLLKNQLKTTDARALFNQVSATYDATIIFLDLASEMLAGASMEDISTVLYLKVLQWAGYSEDLKVAELELMLEKDGKLDAFMERAKQELEGIDWAEARNQPLVANQIASRLAAEFYPKLFTSADEFQNLTLHVSKSEMKRAEEMIDLIKRKSGKKNILFIIDEVGQYVSAKPNLILNLDGLAKNLKQIGGGTVWLFATAQQTLTEDNTSAMINAPGLYKLKDRFPIQVHLEASDIKEICHRRLLTKSASGEQDLGKLFDSNGASLRTATQLKNGGVYETPLDRKTFIELYPFHPSHFEILLQLLGRLAKKTGGLGLRSAIKVVQEVLIEKIDHKTCLADRQVGELANTVTFYDSMRRDIQSSYSYIVDGVEQITKRFPEEALYLSVGKSIAVLQILTNLPVTVQNIAALMQPNVTSPSLKDSVEKAVAALLKDGMIPLGEKDGGLRFLTQAAITLQKQFDQIEFRQVDVRKEFNDVLRSIFKPLPSARLNGVRPVTAGLKVVLAGGQAVSLEGDKEAIQILTEFVPVENYDTLRVEHENESRAERDRTNIYLLGRSDSESDALAITLVRCRKFLDLHRTASDPETQEYVRIVDERMNRNIKELERKLHAALMGGSFIAHGSHKAVAELGSDVLESSKNFLNDIAGKVFDRYAEAPHQADSGLAEKFLKTQLDRMTTSDDPLGLVARSGGRPQIRLDHKAILSIKDYLGQQGQVEGRRLLDHFSDPRFGWSKDTTRYVLAAAFLGGEIKLRIAGTDHVVKNDDSLGAFVSNKSFGSVGISLRQERPDPEALFRASERLCSLTGENIMPLEDDIAASAKKHFPSYQALYAPLATELRMLGLENGSQCDRADNLTSDLAEVVSGDGSDAVRRLGGTESSLYESLVWARKLKNALDNGLRATLDHLKALQRGIQELPDSGAPAMLKESSQQILENVTDMLSRDSFFNETSSLNNASAQLDALVVSTAGELSRQQQELVLAELNRWEEISDWNDLSDDEHIWFRAEADKLIMATDSTLAGLKKLLAHDYSLNNRLRELSQAIVKKAADRRTEIRTKQEALPEQSAEIIETELIVPKVFKSVQQIDLLITELGKLRTRITREKHARIRWKEID